MQKILIVGWGYPPKIDGGLDIVVKELFEELQKRENIEVDLLLPEDRAPDKENIIPVNVEGDMLSKARQLSRAAAENASEYDIIHTHDWFGVEAGFKAQKYSNVKWVSSFHSISSSRSRNPSREIEKLEKVGATQPDTVTAVSDKLSEEITSEYGEKPDTVYNGFSQPVSGQEIDLDFERPVFFFVGRHAEQKGVEHLIYGFKKFVEESKKGTLLIGGKGHMQDSFKNFVKILGIEDHVSFEGFIEEEDLRSYYSAADAFVSPSINEPFGLTISEALSCGTQVVCTKSGINELLEPEAVTVVNPNSDSIKKGLEKGLEKDKFNFESRSWSEMAEDYIKIYRDLA